MAESRPRTTGFTLPWRSAEHGFTLIELMVVIVIIGLAATAVLLAMPEPGGSLRAEAVRFAARAKAARDAAIVEARPVMVRIGPGGYDVASRERGEWRVRSRYAWAERTRAAGPAAVRFDATGLAEPAALTLVRGDRQATVTIGGGGDVRVEE
jgi:general secretion pathway protein H